MHSQKVQETADLLGLSPLTVRLWITKGRLRSIRLSERSIRIPAEEVNRLIAKGRTRWEKDRG
jgi:excisionase family DNA binding protein